jgi:sugar O-acyltransferase (sialic acid O-acetyltransferase NeuD family)
MSSTAPSRLLILGAGTFAVDVADLVSDIDGYEVAGFVVSVPPFQSGATLLGKPIHWVDDAWLFVHNCQALGAIVSTKRAAFVARMAEFGFTFATLVHPTARVSRAATLGAGTLIGPGAIISAHAEIGQHVIINRGALIGHHVKIGDGATVSPGANLAGAVTVGSRAYIGMGAVVLEKRQIGEQSLVGAASLVSRDVPPHSMVMGSPARVVEANFNGY